MSGMGIGGRATRRTVSKVPSSRGSARVSVKTTGTSRRPAIEMLDEHLDMPPDESIAKRGPVYLRCSGGREDWQLRSMLTTSEIIGFTLKTRGTPTRMRDFIPLKDIRSVDKFEHVNPLEFLHSGIVSSSIVNNVDGAVEKRESSFRLKKSTSRYRLTETGDLEHVSVDGTAVTTHSFVVRTSERGWNSGRTYLLRCKHAEDTEAWVAHLRLMAAAASYNNESNLPLFKRFKTRLARFYFSWPSQTFWGLMIAANFCCNIWEAQQPDARASTQEMFKNLDILFTCIFSFEVIISLLSSWFKAYWMDAWNVFDFFVVALSIIALSAEGLPVISTLRLLRVFRAVRLFRKFTSLRIITNAIIGSLVPVLNTVLILILVTSMFAIVAVDLYHDRGKLQGSNDFKNFYFALFTMYQVSTGDSWASAIARPLFYDDPPGPENANEVEVSDYSPLVFFSIYTVVSSVILLNVVVAVLLQNFQECVDQDRAQTVAQKTDDSFRAEDLAPLDPILVSLSAFDEAKLIERYIRLMFYRLDGKRTGKITWMDMASGLREMPFVPSIYFTVDDFDVFTNDRENCDEDGNLDEEWFTTLFQDQLEHFYHRQLGRALVSARHATTSQEENMLLSLKMIYETTKRQGLDATAAPRAPAESREPGAGGARPAKVTPQNHAIHVSALPGLADDEEEEWGEDPVERLAAERAATREAAARTSVKWKQTLSAALTGGANKGSSGANGDSRPAVASAGDGGAPGGTEGQHSTGAGADTTPPASATASAAVPSMEVNGGQKLPAVPMSMSASPYTSLFTPNSGAGGTYHY